MRRRISCTTTRGRSPIKSISDRHRLKTMRWCAKLPPVIGMTRWPSNSYLNSCRSSQARKLAVVHGRSGTLSMTRDPSQVFSGRLRRPVPLAQELEELHALAQPALHHLRATDHLADDRGDLRRTEVEALIECLDVVEDFGVRQVLVRQRGDLHAVLVDQFGMLGGEPAILHRLAIEEGAGIWRGQRHLDGVRVDSRGEADGLLDGLLRLARQPQDEGAVDLDAEVVAVAGE